MSQPSAAVRMTVVDGIAEVIFDRPQALNAIDVATAEGFLEVCEALQVRTDVRVIVLSGAGRAFMAGGDLVAFHAAADMPALASAIIEPLHRALLLLSHMPQLVLGSVHGAVSGAGMSIALGCDMTLAASDARFCLAYTAIATSIDGGGSWHLLRQVGRQRALELALLNSVLSAEQVLQLGLICRVVAPDELREQTWALARKLAQGPSFAFAQVKHLLRQAARKSLGEQLQAEHEAFRACAGTADFREGINAFIDKRKPQFVGS
jgi:2-(1,2-epoxy-1,2-dihydrophenyl)acetyl-CoA isomerase